MKINYRYTLTDYNWQLDQSFYIHVLYILSGKISYSGNKMNQAHLRAQWILVLFVHWTCHYYIFNGTSKYEKEHI